MITTPKKRKETQREKTKKKNIIQKTMTKIHKSKQV